MAKKQPYEIEDIRCSHCGRFLGKGDIKQGVVVILCKCKQFTATMGEEDEKYLTGSKIRDIISSR